MRAAHGMAGLAPFAHRLGDDADGLHGGQAELGIADGLALDPFALRFQVRPGLLKLADDLFQFVDRGRAEVLDQRRDVVAPGLWCHVRRHGRRRLRRVRRDEAGISLRDIRHGRIGERELFRFHGIHSCIERRAPQRLGTRSSGSKINAG